MAQASWVHCAQCNATVQLSSAACPKCGQSLNDERQAFFTSEVPDSANDFGEMPVEDDFAAPARRQAPEPRYEEPREEPREQRREQRPVQQPRREHAQSYPYAPHMNDSQPDGALEDEVVLWSGAPDPVFGPVARRTVFYEVTNKAIRIRTGILGKTQTQVELWRYKDARVTRSLLQRTAKKTGTLIIETTDEDTPVLYLNDVPDPEGLQKVIRNAYEAQWRSRRMGGVYIEKD